MYKNDKLIMDYYKFLKSLLKITKDKQITSSKKYFVKSIVIKKLIKNKIINMTN
jgi:hypothetical protein